MFRRLSWLAFLFLMCFALSFSVLADDDVVSDDNRGFWEFAQNHFRGDDDTDDVDEAPEATDDIATYDNDGIALMSVTTEDIDEGNLTIKMYGT